MLITETYDEESRLRDCLEKTRGIPPKFATGTWLFSVTLIKCNAQCLHINKTRCLRCGSTITLYLLTSPPTLLYLFQKIGFLPEHQGRRSKKKKKKKKKRVVGIWSCSPVDEWLLMCVMCGKCIWLSWPLWGKAKIFFEAIEILGELFFHHTSIYQPSWKLSKLSAMYK